MPILTLGSIWKMKSMHLDMWFDATLRKWYHIMTSMFESSGLSHNVVHHYSINYLFIYFATATFDVLYLLLAADFNCGAIDTIPAGDGVFSLVLQCNTSEKLPLTYPQWQLSGTSTLCGTGRTNIYSSGVYVRCISWVVIFLVNCAELLVVKLFSEE